MKPLLLKTLRALSLLLVAAALLTGCNTQQPVTTLRLAHTLDQEHVVHKAMALMGERLANDIRCLGAGLAASFVKGSLASLASTLRLPSVRQALKTTQLSLSSRRSIKSGTVGFARAPITEIARMLGGPADTAKKHARTLLGVK